MKKILIIPYDLNHLGGGSSVAAWAMQALVAQYAVSILTWDPADLRITNRHFGTRLKPEDFRWFTVKPRLRQLMSLIPMPLAHLKRQLLYGEARRLNATEHFDIVFGAINEIDIGVRAVQYIHFPWVQWPRPRADLRWYHVPALMHAYRWFSRMPTGYDLRRIADNVSLANSDWTGGVFEKCYGVRPRTLYPPVSGGFPVVPFEERARAFTCVGRIAPEKKIEQIIQILAAVRARGHALQLQIIGPVHTPAYLRRIKAMAAPHQGWISYHHDVTREELAHLVVRNRYGIHAMTDEHFGIAPAELQRAGCITFVPHSGGPPEIVDRDERLVYRSIDDAVEKIDRVLSDPALESELRREVELRSHRFTEQRFMDEIRAIMNSFDSATRG